MAHLFIFNSVLQDAYIIDFEGVQFINFFVICAFYVPSKEFA